MIWQFAACIPFFLFCALSVPVFLLFRLPLPLLLLLCMAGCVLIGLQVWLVRESRRSAAELDALLACIEAAGAGRLEGAPGSPGRWPTSTAAFSRRWRSSCAASG